MAMVSFRLLSILCPFLILISQTNAQSPNYLGHFCSNHSGNHTENSPYETNLMTLLTSVSTNTEVDYGFYNFSYGQNSEKVNAIGLCRADLNVDDCLSCLNISRILVTQKCPNQKEAIVYYDICMLRYSNRSIFGIREDEPTFSLSNPNNVTDRDVAQFNQALGNLMHNLTSIASSGDSRHKVAGRNVSAGSRTIFGLVQCTPDLSQVDCETCLLGAISQKIPSCCKDKIGGRIHRPSCTARFEIYSFYNAILDVPEVSPPPPSTNNTDGNNTSRIVIATVVPIVAISLLLVFIRIYSKVRKSKKNYEAEDEIANSESLRFHFDTIRAATDNFSDANKLGQGGFGAVYKGRLTNGQEVAVKRLSINSGQGETEFKNEVRLVAKLQHRNLVRLLGFCLEGRERLLIYEFVQNKSLDYYIFGVHVDPSKHSQLNWEMRYKIIEGIARGVLYLHEDSQLRIIHRDLKASNILLDKEMNAKISDFGMARLVVMDQTQVKTNKIVGTYGYMAPEFALLGQFSMKSDIFSFGVLVLEIVSGCKNSGICHGEYKEHLASFTWKHWKEGTVENIIDPTLNNDSRNEMLRCIHIGLLCVQENIVDRPTMSAVVRMLNNPALPLPVPSAPAFLIDGKKFSNMALWEFNLVATGTSESKNKSVQESINEISVTELYLR